MSKPTPLVKYQAYELVRLEDRSILQAPAPGLEVYLAADVERWLRDAANHAKIMSEQHLAEGVYTQSRSWEGGWHTLERLLLELEGKK